MGAVEQAAAARERLGSRPDVYRVPAPDLELFLLRDFLDERECRGLIALIDADREPSRLLAEEADPDFRTSESCNLDPCGPLARAAMAALPTWSSVIRTFSAPGGVNTPLASPSRMPV